ncbi:MAG: epoxide hydrolase N-terminal domain-containing protein, partial [Brevibacterium sp.]|nr:epoxide hydrolase N-terminal domain-containing protein [Brevibacterium sp.]
MSDTRPFQRNVAQSELDELNARLARTRWTDQLPGVGWSHGVNGDYLRDSVGGQSICFASVRPSRSIEITNKISFEVVGSMTTSVDVLQYIKFALPEVSVTKAMK